MTKVRFLLRKRYPHPDGPKRPVGAVLPIDADLARLWSERGVVETVDAPADADAKADAAEAGGDLAKVPLTGLREALAAVEDSAVVEEAQERDDRKGAQSMYTERLAELNADSSGGEDEGDTGSESPEGAEGAEGDDETG